MRGNCRKAYETIIAQRGDRFQTGWMPAFSGGFEISQVFSARAIQLEGGIYGKRYGHDHRSRSGKNVFHKFMAAQPACIAAMEACGSAHYWAREIARMGHAPKLIAPGYMKPFAS